MSLNSTPSSERVHIGFFGVRNAGKSSLLNAVIGQDLAVVSDAPGTTTDPVRKAMELLPLGPVVVIDTPGFDDAGELGELRVSKTRETLRRCDIAVLVVDALKGPGNTDDALCAMFREQGTPYIIAYSKGDLLDDESAQVRSIEGDAGIVVSAKTGQGIGALKDKIAKIGSSALKRKPLVADLLVPGDVVVLVVPIDESAPKGRIILPQQMTIRDILDAHAACVVCQVAELSALLERLAFSVRLVVTDSQAFGEVARIVPERIPLTSFSILMARYKGELASTAANAAKIGDLRSGDTVLVAEGCTHHRQCADIGTVKMPAWIRSYCGAHPRFEFVSGTAFPESVSDYALVLHCGGCMLNDREMRNRAEECRREGTPIVNYGTAIAQMNGILERSLAPFEGDGGNDVLRA